MKIKKDDILDELLVMRTQNGDMEAFSQLVNRWQPALLRQAYRLTRDEDAALDVAQDAWHDISKGIGSLKYASAFRTWAYRIVSNKSVNWVRSQQKRREIEQDVEPKSGLEEDENEMDSVEILRSSLAKLPVKSRVILSMFYIDNYSLKEVAGILILREGTVKSRLFHARKILKEKLEENKQHNDEREQ